MRAADVRNQSSPVSLPCDLATEELLPDTGLLGVFSYTPRTQTLRNSIHTPDNHTVPGVLNTTKPPTVTQALTHTLSSQAVCSQLLITPKDTQSPSAASLKELPALSHSRSHGGSELHTDVQVGMEVTSSHGMPLQRQLRLSTHSLTQRW